MIDECIITIIPISLKEGIKLELPYDSFVLEAEDFDHRSLHFLSDVLELCDSDIRREIRLVIEKLANIFDIKSIKLAEITQLDTEIMKLFEITAPLMSMEIWNTFNGWIKQHNPELSSGVAYSLENYAEKTKCITQ